MYKYCRSMIYYMDYYMNCIDDDTSICSVLG